MWQSHGESAVISIVDRHGHYETFIAVEGASGGPGELLWMTRTQPFYTAGLRHFHGIDRTEVHAIRLEFFVLL